MINNSTFIHLNWSDVKLQKMFIETSSDLNSSVENINLKDEIFEREIQNLNFYQNLENESIDKVVSSLSMREEFKRLSKIQLKNLVITTNQVPCYLMPKALEMIRTMDCASILFTNGAKLAEIFIMKALIQNDISVDEAVKFLLFSQSCAIDGYMRTKFQLYDENGCLDSRAESVLKAALKPSSEEGFRLLMNEFKLIKPEDSEFFMRFITKKNDEKSEPFVTNFLRITEHDIGVMEEFDNIYQVVFPPQMMRVILNWKFGENQMIPNFVFGLSEPENFENAFQRDVFIPNHFFDQPRYFDGVPCNNLTFYHHDLVYHIWLESTNPHRLLWVDLCLYAKENYADLFNNHQEILNLLRDREMNYGLKKLGVNESYYFFYFLNKLFLTQVKKVADVDFKTFCEDIFSFIKNYNQKASSCEIDFTQIPEQFLSVFGNFIGHTMALQNSMSLSQKFKKIIDNFEVIHELIKTVWAIQNLIENNPDTSALLEFIDVEEVAVKFSALCKPLIYSSPLFKQLKDCLELARKENYPSEIKALIEPILESTQKMVETVGLSFDEEMQLNVFYKYMCIPQQ